jgi:hypothetical protein
MLFRNRSTKDLVVFEKGASYRHFGSNYDLKAADMDMDGLTDLVSTNYSLNNFAIYRNISAAEGLGMEPRVDWRINAHPMTFDIADLNGDRKPDLMIRVAFEDVVVVKNTGKPGAMDFAAPIRIASGIQTADIKASDLDSDGKIDFVTSGQKPTLFRNLCTADTLIFEVSRINIVESSDAIDVSDLNGDGRPDIILGAKKNSQFPPSDFQGLMVLENHGSKGMFRFGEPVKYQSSVFAVLKAADINSDGLTDIVSSGLTWKNMGQVVTNIGICQRTDTLLTEAASSNTYQWQIDRGAGFVNLQDNAMFSGTGTSNLRIISADTSLHNKQFRCLLDNNRAGRVYRLMVTLSVAPAVDIKVVSGTLCPGASVTLQASYVNGGNSPELVWYRGGALVASGTDLLQIPQVQRGDSIWATLRSDVPCSPLDSVASNKLFASSSRNSITVQITGNPQQVPGVPLMMNAQATHAQGTSVTYQWQDSTSSHSWQPIPGANGSSLSYTVENSGDKLRVEVIGKNACGITDTVYSSAVVLTVLAQDPEPRVYPNPVAGELFINGLLPDDNWQQLTIINEFGARIHTMGISGQTSVRVDVQKLPKGYYSVILYRSGGDPVSRRFLKL